MLQTRRLRHMSILSLRHQPSVSESFPLAQCEYSVTAWAREL